MYSIGANVKHLKKKEGALIWGGLSPPVINWRGGGGVEASSPAPLFSPPLLYNNNNGGSVTKITSECLCVCIH